MNQPITSLTAASLNLALDAAQLRQQAMARNLANAQSSGYAAQHVSFEERLAPLRAENGRQKLTIQHLQGAQPRLVSDPQAAPLTVDGELAQMAGNAVHYQSLLKLLNRHYAVLSLAVSDGKR